MPNPTPHPETPTERRDRQLAYFRRLADLSMRAAEIAAEQIEAAHATGEPHTTASPTLDLARATRAVTLAVNAENAVAAGQAAPSARADDPRRPLLREALYAAAKNNPNPTARAALRRDIDDRVEEILAADPDAETDLPDHLFALADEFQLPLDPARLRDELLGMPPRKIILPGEYECTTPDLVVTPLDPADRNPTRRDPPNPTVQYPDLERPDLERPDLERPGLERPDLERPDLERPDLERPDRQDPDLQDPDLRHADSPSRPPHERPPTQAPWRPG